MIAAHHYRQSFVQLNVDGFAHENTAAALIGLVGRVHHRTVRRGMRGSSMKWWMPLAVGGRWSMSVRGGRGVSVMRVHMVGGRAWSPGAPLWPRCPLSWMVVSLRSLRRRRRCSTVSDPSVGAFVRRYVGSGLSISIGRVHVCGSRWRRGAAEDVLRMSWWGTHIMRGGGGD